MELPPFEFVIWGVSEAEIALRKSNALKTSPFTHIVSLQGVKYREYPDSLEKYAERTGAKVCVCRFDDIKKPEAGWTHPTTEEVQKLIDFEIPEGSFVLFHCAAGVSRSSASAYVKLCQARPGKETEMLEAVIERQKFCYPNELILKLSEEILEKDGEILRPFWKSFRELGYGKSSRIVGY